MSRHAQIAYFDTIIVKMVTQMADVTLATKQEVLYGLSNGKYTYTNFDNG